MHCGIAKLLQSSTCHVSLLAVADAWEKKMESVGTVAAPAVLLADIGGTNARFSLRVGDALGPVAHLAVAEHPRFIDALSAFLAQHGSGCRITAAILAVAGPTKNGRAELTNSTWIIDGAELAAELGCPVQVVNDFEALARAVPALGRRMSLPFVAASRSSIRRDSCWGRARAWGRPASRRTGTTTW